MNKSVRVVAACACAALIVGLGTMPGPAHASVDVATRPHPAGAVAVSPTSGLSSSDSPVRLLAGDADYLVFDREGRDMYAIDADGHETDLGPETPSVSYELGGDLLEWITSDAGGSEVVDWLNIKTSATGSEPYDGMYFLGATSTGWTYVKYSQAFTETTGGVTTSLGNPFGATEDLVGGSADDTGALVLSQTGSADFVSYADPADPVTVPTLYSMPSEELSCQLSGEAALCTGFEDSSDAELLSLTGGPAKSIDFGYPHLNGTITDYAITPGLLATAAGSGIRLTNPTGGDVRTLDWNSDFIAALGELAVTDPEQTGIDLLAGPDSMSQRLVGPKLANAGASVVAQTVGSTYWVDDAAKSGRNESELESRSTVVDHHAVRLGAPRQVASHQDIAVMTPGSQLTTIAASGANVIWATRSSSGGTIHVSTPFGRFSRPASDVVGGLSGDRELFPARADRLAVLDLGTHKVTTVKSKAAFRNLAALDLWGNYLAYERRGGSLWRDDLATGKATELLPPGSIKIPDGLSQVFEFGDWIAWTSFDEEDGVPHDRSGYLNVRHPHRVLSLGSSSTDDVAGLSANGLLLESPKEDDLSRVGVYLRGYGRHAVTKTLISASYDGDVRQVFDPDAGVAGSVFGWWQDGIAYAAPLPVVNVRPWDLGDPIHRRTFIPGSGKTWKLLVPFDAALTSCKVVLHKKNRVLRTLPCSSRYMRNGDAVGSWNGRCSSGAKVAGKVTWTLHASGPAGAALNASGKPGPIGGTVTVS